MATQRNCTICLKSLNELGAYVKLSGARYAHLPCFVGLQSEIAVNVYKQQLAEAKASAEYEAAEKAQAAQLAAFSTLPRCPRCGVRVSTTGLWTQGETVMQASGSAACAPCTRLEAQIRASVRSTAPSLLQLAPSAPVKPDAPRREPSQVSAQDSDLLRRAREAGGLAIDLD